MNKRHFSGRNGGASIFLCIILSAVILTQGTLYYAARLRGYEAELNRCLRLQLSQILCNYNEALLENYGLYGVDASSVNTKIFDACFSGGDGAVLVAQPSSILTTDDLRTGISDYMQIRMPAAMSGEILSRIKGVCREIKGCSMFTRATDADSSAWLGYVKDFLAQKDKWSDVISKVVSAVEVIDVTGKMKELEDFSSSLQKTLERSATLNLQGGSTKDSTGNILNPEGLSVIMGYVDSYMNFELPNVTDAIMINEYAVSFFDSEVENFQDEDTKKPESNLLGVPFSDIHGSNRGDLEYLLSGSDNELISFAAAKVLIGDIRLIINFGTYLLDQEKMNRAKEIAAILSEAVAVASLGTVVADPEILQFVVLYVWALGQALSDVFSLINGKSIILFEHSAINDNTILEDALMTNYRDYLGLLLMAVPLEWKLSRILTILKKDCGSELYTGVSLSTEYRGYRFSMEDTYDAYSSE